MKKRILVTGGAGFLGSNFVNYLTQHYPEYAINVYDKLTYAGNKNSLSESFFDIANQHYIFTEACVADRKKMTEAITNADIVVHFACESHVTNSLAQADDFVSTNVLGTMVICEEIIKYPVEKLILVSSSEVYGTALTKPMDEGHPLNPASPYAGSKAGQDRLAFSYYQSFDIPLIILRPFNQYGPHQHIEKVIPKFITNLLQKKKITIENRGIQTRDWLYVEDTCRALTNTIHTNNETIVGETINVGSGKETSIMTIANMIAERLNLDPQEHFTFGHDRRGQVISHISSLAKARALLDWEPLIDIEEGLRRTVKWYVDNDSWWRKLKFPVLKVAEMGS